jgi:DNA-binding Lrp family transcriptional regulator
MDGYGRMAFAEPRYWGSWKGRVISAIVTAGDEQTWTELHEKTGLAPTSLNRVLAELFQDQAIIKKEEGIQVRYRVPRDLYDQYKTFLNLNYSSEAAKKKWKRLSAKFGQTRKTKLVNWIEEWKRLSNLEFSLDNKHFFLEGMHLDELSKHLIGTATREVLVVNPFVDHCDLSNVLRKASKNVEVILVTHPPEDNDQFSRDRSDRREYHLTLTKEGVKLIYNRKVHAKLIVIDRAVAIVSSMNLYGSSSGGATWEAGLVSIEDTVVESIADSILSLIERPESRQIAPTNNK